ncbi:MAG TPA: GspMb/PilO family protein [Caulobacter sp.]|nr:GspMb/PilO family protein [Caulobacter sp.]
MKLPGGSPLLAAVAVMLGLAVAASSAWLLAVIASPADFSERLAAVQAQTAKGAPAPGPVDAASFPVGAVCRDSLVRAAPRVRQALAAKTAGAGLAASSLSVTPGSATRELAALDIAVEAAGSYLQIVSLLDALAGARPMIFVDNADIEPAAGAFKLKLSGQAYCWTSATR